MSYKITMRPGHPKRRFRRDGHVFSEAAPVILEELSDALVKELEKPGTYLRCEEVAPGQEEATALEAEAAARKKQQRDERPTTSQLLKMRKAELMALAQDEGIDVSGEPHQADLVAYLENRYREDPPAAEDVDDEQNDDDDEGQQVDTGDSDANEEDEEQDGEGSDSNADDGD